MMADIRQALGDTEGARFDVVIAGAGPAGISLALALSGQGLSIALLEAGGGEGPDDAGPDHYHANSIGIPYPVLASRQRFFGGTSNHWGGWVRPFDPVDFEDRPGQQPPGWPIDYDELARWYEGANRLCEIEHPHYDPGDDIDPSALLPLDESSPYVNRVFRFSPPTRFGTRYGDELARAQDISVFLHATLIRPRFAADRVVSCVVADPDGRERLLECGQLVLASGGLEVARTLLQSPLPSGALPGNEGGWLGRCFMEHFGFSPGTILGPAGLSYELSHQASGAVMPVLAPAPARLLATGARNLFMTLRPTEPDRQWPPEALTTPGLARQLAGAEPWRYRVIMTCEQRPNPESRVSLGDTQDRFGLRHLDLNWQLKDADLIDLDAEFRQLGAWLGQQGLGRVQQLQLAADMVESPSLTGGMHHMGTTRMARHAGEGVVDRDCRVFGTENLYVASSSVFSTSGYANPTLSIVALSLRLADHLLSAGRR